MGKLEKNMHQTRKFLAISETKGATMTATTPPRKLLPCN